MVPLIQRLPARGPLISVYFCLCADILALLIKNNKNIKEIKVGDIEYLVSQYADDTSLILDGSEQSF